MSLLDLKISVEETDRVLRRLIHDVSKFRNRHREGICLGLTLIYKNIHGWYNEINDVFSPEIAEQITGEIDQEKHRGIITKITKFTRRSRRQVQGRNSTKFLEQIMNDKDYRKVLDKSNINIDSIESLKQDILRDDKEHGFVDLALDRKRSWLKQAAQEKNWKVEAEVIDSWIEELEYKHNVIIDMISGLLNKLACTDEKAHALYEELIR